MMAGTWGSDVQGEGRYLDVLVDAFVWEDGAAVDVDLVSDGYFGGDVFEAGPLADSGVPADDGALDPCMVADLGALEDDASFETDAVADGAVGADNDVGADAAAAADLGRGMDDDVSAVDVGACVVETGGLVFGKRGQVETGAGQVVLWVPNVLLSESGGGRMCVLWSWPWAAIAGKISFSMLVGRREMRCRMDVLKTYIPALILLLTNSTGFSTKRSISELEGFITTTPYLEGSSTFVTTIVPSALNCVKLYSQMMSELRTKKGELSFSSILRASASGPAVPGRDVG
ncbi:hypothetical protein PMAC_000357 [Pneumocystis sp. 'macacae']|nr:hypothetical protein PMAC_000357 [Pneumocystis sp. 'macacae']